jgi:hypothetical protein
VLGEGILLAGINGIMTASQKLHGRESQSISRSGSSIIAQKHETILKTLFGWEDFPVIRSTSSYRLDIWRGRGIIPGSASRRTDVRVA